MIFTDKDLANAMNLKNGDKLILKRQRNAVFTVDIGTEEVVLINKNSIFSNYITISQLLNEEFDLLKGETE